VELIFTASARSIPRLAALWAVTGERAVRVCDWHLKQIKQKFCQPVCILPDRCQGRAGIGSRGEKKER